MAKGKVNGVSRDIYLDTGAQMCVIPPKWCRNSDVPTKKIGLSSVYGIKRQHEVVKVDVELFGQSFSCEAALVDSDETDYLLMGPSIGSDLYWDLLKARREPNLRVRETRVQSKRRKEEDLRCRQLDELDGATPHLDELVAESSQVAEVTETDDSTLSADDEEDPPLSPAVAEGEDECIPLPVLDSHQREELIECTAKDSSLERVKKYADEGSMGYNGIGITCSCIHGIELHFNALMWLYSFRLLITSVLVMISLKLKFVLS